MRRALIAAFLFASAIAHADPADPEEPAFACKRLAPGTKVMVTMHPQVTLAEVAQWASGFTCKNIVFTEGAAGERLTIVAPQPMTVKEAYQLFLDTLAADDLVAIEKGNTVIIKDAPGKHRCPPATAAIPPATPPRLDLPPISSQPPPPPPPDEALDPAIEAGLHAVDATHCTITRAALDVIIATPGSVMRTVRIVPAVKDGKAYGFKLYAIRPGSLVARLGFKNGDVLQTLNGRDMLTPDAAVAAYSAARDADVWHLGGTRVGAPFELEIRVVP